MPRERGAPLITQSKNGECLLDTDIVNESVDSRL